MIEEIYLVLHKVLDGIYIGDGNKIIWDSQLLITSLIACALFYVNNCSVCLGKYTNSNWYSHLQTGIFLDMCKTKIVYASYMFVMLCAKQSISPKKYLAGVYQVPTLGVRS